MRKQRFHFEKYYKLNSKTMSNQCIIPVSDITKLSELQYKKKPILMEFHTEWCPPCKAAHALLEKEMRESGGKFIIAHVNSDQAEELNIEYEIEGVPTLIVINEKNEPIDKVIGYDPKKIKDLVDRVIRKDKK